MHTVPVNSEKMKRRNEGKKKRRRKEREERRRKISRRRIQLGILCGCAKGFKPESNPTLVAAIYLLSMAGHFALGNSNSIATIDVAGAFTGLSSHSTTLAGILMFCITYASPLLFQISGIMCLPMESLQFSSTPHKSELSHGLLTTIGLPCLVPLALNSFSLTAFTIILLLMRNHLFVWSVFSPKYLYICAATASIYIGVLIIATSVTFVFLVLFWRLHRTNSQT